MSELMRDMLDLNAIDRKIVRGKLHLQEVTRAVAAQERVLEESRENARKIEQTIKDKMFSADRLNMDLSATQAENSEQERKIRSVKGQREYRIVTDKIRDLKIRADELESSLLENMTSLDTLREQLMAAHNKVGEEDLKLTSTRQQAQEEVNGIKARHAALLEERKAAVQKVARQDASAYEAYDLALKRTKGDPIAEMSMDGICQSCFRRQNSNVVNTVHIGEDVKTCRCQGCGRILYVKQGSQDEE